MAKHTSIVRSRIGAKNFMSDTNVLNQCRLFNLFLPQLMYPRLIPLLLFKRTRRELCKLNRSRSGFGGSESLLRQRQGKQKRLCLNDDALSQATDFLENDDSPKKILLELSY